MIGLKVCVRVMLLILSVSLTACSTQGNSALNTTRQKTLIQKLQDKHINVLVVGEQMSLILPADEFFQPCSPAIKANAYSALNDVASLIRHYPKTSLVITGYTDNLGSSQRNMALSTQRARATADYLWSQDIDTRLLYTEGKGSDDPLANNKFLKGRQWNRRIEITFQLLPR